MTVKVPVAGFRVWEQVDMFGERRLVMACSEPGCGWLVSRSLAWVAFEADAAGHREEHRAGAGGGR